MKILNFLIDIFFPKKCVFCSENGAFACENCLLKIILLNKQCCPECRTLNLDGRFCSFECAKNYHFDRLIVCAEHEKNSLLAKLIYSLKYKFYKEIAEPLADILFSQFLKFKIDGENYFVACVPSHKKRIRFRGFNQSELLAQRFSKLAGLKFLDCLERVKYQTAQAGLEREERLKNLCDNFRVKRGGSERMFFGKKFFLVDDVATTCSTLNECSKILKQNGAKAVICLVLARGRLIK